MAISPRSDIALDFDRTRRIGFAEAILCAGKSLSHLVEIVEQLGTQNGCFILTRLEAAVFALMPETTKARLDFDALSRTALIGRPASSPTKVSIAIVAAGTSDAPVVREAERTLQANGHQPTVIVDVGVAGLWRLLDRLDEIRKHQVIIAVAGMDAALPTVLGGLVSAPIISVPTSTGYGASEAGRTALNAMLASCASGLAVVNIDNGFGAACAALRIAHAVAAG